MPEPSGSLVEAAADVLALSVAPTTMAAMLSAVLGPSGISVAVVRAVLYMVLRAAQHLGRPETPGPAVRAAMAAEPAYRAAYLVNAAVRVQNSVNAGLSLEQATAREHRNYEAHVLAQAKRRQAARAVDRVAEDVPVADAYGPAAPPGSTGTVPLCGWKAVLDSRTSPECRAADGMNFRVDRPPLIGYPGTVHLHCRCRAVKPYRRSSVLDPLTPVMPHA